jgi:hypothetical protein
LGVLQYHGFNNLSRLQRIRMSAPGRAQIMKNRNERDGNAGGVRFEN